MGSSASSEIDIFPLHRSGLQEGQIRGRSPWETKGGFVFTICSYQRSATYGMWLSLCMSWFDPSIEINEYGQVDPGKEMQKMSSKCQQDIEVGFQ